MARSTRDVTGIQREIEQFRERVGLLQEAVDRRGAVDEHALTAALEELHIAVAELLTNEEDMRLKQQQFGEMEMRLQRERRMYEELFEQAPDAYIMTTSDGVIQEANALACSLLQGRKDILIGKPLLVFVIDSQHKSYLDALTRLITSHSPRIRDWQFTLKPSRPVSATVAVDQPAEHEPRTLRWLLRDL